MVERRDLLMELGTEELPPRALRTLMQALADEVVKGLQEHALEYQSLHAYATPRRLALWVRALTAQQPDRPQERRGPALAAAFDDEGVPTKAALGFARSCGCEVDTLDTLTTEQGSWLVHRTLQTGRSTVELVPALLQHALERLPIPKRMRWSDLDVEFVRPAHWLVMLFGEEVIEAQVLGLRAGRCTRGHRFHHPEDIHLSSPAAYAPLLETEGRVLADFDQRREAIRGQVMEAAQTMNGRAVIDEDLLDEVTAMVEWPVAVMGAFDQRFLQVPAEALVSAMKGHQKYFHVIDAHGHLMPRFITVSNIESNQPDMVRHGNERVIRPRLADAEFFWQQDRKRTLESRVDSLGNIVFQQKLGSLRHKVERVTRLAGVLARALEIPPQAGERAAYLCKTDLVTEMVGEFPELQGIMGRYYAVHDGEPEEVALAIEEHYLPRFSGDRLPTTDAGRVLALADKLDTLVGIFGIGQNPTGDKDPFALRRAALGVIRILIEQDVSLDVPAAVAAAKTQYGEQGVALAQTTVAEVLAFLYARLQPFYSAQGLSADAVDAVICLQPRQFNLGDRRLRALLDFRRRPEAGSLTAANKRISNILKKADDAISERWQAALLREPAERQLAEHVAVLEERLPPLFEQRRYHEAMQRLAELRTDVDTFFDQVMVMAEEAELRRNRLALLAQLRGFFLQVADLSRLQGDPD